VRGPFTKHGFMNTISIRGAGPYDGERIRALLTMNKLPANDIPDNLAHFFVIQKADQLVGVIGLEPYGPYGLLRSLVIQPLYRGRGNASDLVNKLIDYAGSLGLTDIYLLTETAERFFLKKGFEKIDRDFVPAELRLSSEFSYICPSSAVAMKKKLLPKKRVLFVCIENSNRSQMSQAFAGMIGGEAIEAYSAGSRPSGKINPKAINAMKELGYDLSRHHSKSLEEVKKFAPFDVVVTMGCGDACPWMPARQFIDWDIPDPREMDEDEFRKVRDLIRGKVAALVKQLSG
jgi:arsenate reductase (thioredoxin)